MNKKGLLQEQLEGKLRYFLPASEIGVPPTGWMKAVRLALGISLQQLANKLSITKQSMNEIELREKDGTITLKSLKEAAKALDMQLVYGLVPKDGSLENLIERKAQELAVQIVNRTSNTMKLEDQKNSAERIKKAIEQRTEDLKREIPKMLWD